MKTINLYRVTITPAANRRRINDSGFEGAFLSKPNKAELLASIVELATELKAQLDRVRTDDDDEFELDIDEIKRKLENLALTLEILNAWKTDSQSIPSDHPIAIQVANVQIGVIKFESELVWDVRSTVV